MKAATLIIISTAALAGAMLAATPATTPAIGIVTASGHFTLRDASALKASELWGNATLFEGATIETGSASSQLALRNGAKVQLSAGSRARVFANRVVLERGVGQMAGGVYEIDAAEFKIRGANASARVRVAWGAGTVEVAALTGAAKISGLVTTTIPSGHNMSFAPQPAVVMRNGCLLYKDTYFILQDEDNREVVQLKGQDFAPNLGNRVLVNGTASTVKPDLPVATQVMNVTSVSPISRGGCLVAAASLDARTDLPLQAAKPPAPAPTATTGGISKAGKIAIVGLAAGGAAGAAIALESGKKSTSP